MNEYEWFYICKITLRQQSGVAQTLESAKAIVEKIAAEDNSPRYKLEVYDDKDNGWYRYKNTSWSRE